MHFSSKDLKEVLRESELYPNMRIQVRDLPLHLQENRK